MNPVYQELLKSVLRKLLTAVATYLLTAGLVDEHLAEGLVSETTALILGVVLMGWSVGWSWVKTWADAYFKRNLAIAGADSNVTTAEQVVAGAAKLQAAGSKPSEIVAEKPTGPGVGPAAVALLLSLGLAANISCTRPNPGDAPDTIAKKTATYATEGVRYVRVAQDAISAYAVAQGGRTEATDVPSKAVRDYVIPAAERLSVALRAYSAASTPDLKKASAAEILKALDEYEKLVGDAIGSRAKLPAGLTTALAQTIVDIRELITNVRKLFNSTQPVTV